MLGHLTAADWRDRVPLTDFQTYAPICDSLHMCLLLLQLYTYMVRSESVYLRNIHMIVKS